MSISSTSVRLLGQPKPAEADPDGTWYTFEKGVQTSDDKKGWADVWMRDHFGWEYKGKHKDLKEAYTQLQLYREALENPPLMVVCDMDRFEVHTNFTGTLKKQHAFDLAGLADPANLDILRRVFTDPNSLKPGITSEAMTVEAAERFAKLADGMRQKGIEPLRAAHFLMKLMFCMFGDDTGLLPPGLFGKLLDTGKANPAMLPRLLQTLFEAMAKGGVYGSDIILWFNGGLFDDAEVLPLTSQEINTLADINEYDWASVEPSIFGTLFERTLDPAKRSQIRAHYTSRADIETLLKPVLLAPLQREWAEVKRKCDEDLWPKVVKASRARGRTLTLKDSPQRKAFDRAILDFTERLAHVRVLDAACGSGNFLYVAIHMLLDLEKEVITYASDRGLSPIPQVNPAQLHGLEINPYAQELAQVVVWIGYLQWMHYNGFKMPALCILYNETDVSRVLGVFGRKNGVPKPRLKTQESARRLGDAHDRSTTFVTPNGGPLDIHGRREHAQSRNPHVLVGESTQMLGHIQRPLSKSFQGRWCCALVVAPMLRAGFLRVVRLDRCAVPVFRSRA